jgi:cell division protein FtsB
MRWLGAVLLLVLLVLQYRLWVGDGSLAEVWALREEIDTQQKELAQLRSRNQTLEAEVLDLREGLDALEERARSELGMIKEGEMFLQVIEEPSDEPPETPVSAAGNQRTSQRNERQGTGGG